MTASGTIIIPDRLVLFKDLTAVIIDYKTGDHYDKYETQLETYSDIVQEMGYKVSKKILVYVNSNIEIKLLLG